MTYLWLKALHVAGTFLWFGGIVAGLHLLRAASTAPAQSAEDFARREGNVGRLMDIGSGIALLGGIGMLHQAMSLLRGAGFMHAKLTLVVVLIGLHGFVRASLKRYRTGKAKTYPAFALPVVYALFFAITALILVRPF